MVTKPVEIITACFGWGAKRHATQDGPLYLTSRHFFDQLKKTHQEMNVQPLQANLLYADGITLSYTERLQEVHKFTDKLSQTVNKTIQKERFPIIIGGDHSIAIGTWSGVIHSLQAYEEFGLIWIDAHMDSHTPQTSPSMAIHGMPLAVLLGKGELSLTRLFAQTPKINPKHLVLIGVRSFEKGEADFLKGLNVKIYYMSEVRKRGFDTVFQEAINIIKAGTKGYGVSIDLDGFDPSLVPGVGSPENEGIDPQDCYESLAKINQDPQYKALEIVEYNPSRDIKEKTMNVIHHLISTLWQHHEKK